MKFLNSLHHIKVLGRELQVRSTASSERVRQIEGYINCKIEELEASTRCNDPLLIAILALLNITESLLDISTQSAECSKKDNERISRLLQHIENTVK